jgi:hypothetical protein
VRTPAQAYGHPDFVTDVPIQGPTDEGIRAADCWWTQNVLPKPPGNGQDGPRPSCVDCTGPIPTWANNPTAWGGGPRAYGGNGGNDCGNRWIREPVRRAGRYVAGFALDGTGDPAAALASDQQGWVNSALSMLNRRITATTGSSCASWQEPGTNLAAAVGCFQGWVNGNGKGSLRTDGVFDDDTLNALISVAEAHPDDFPTPYPDDADTTTTTAAALPNPPPAPAATVTVPAAAAATPPPPASPPPPAGSTMPEPPPMPVAEAKSKLRSLNTNEKIALGVASAIVAGGVIYTATRKKR